MGHDPASGDLAGWCAGPPIERSEPPPEHLQALVAPAG